MNAKALFRGLVILLSLFVVLYVGMANPHRVDFYFPIMLKEKISQPAALLFFGMFAIGVIVGMMLNANAGKKSEGSEVRKKK